MKNPDIRPNMPQAYDPLDHLAKGAYIVIAVILIWICSAIYLFLSAIK
jgi:hypothetical protein